MSTNYSTIQQHQPLRVPQGWNQQEKMLVLQLDETFDDIYKRFGRLRLEDMGTAFRKRIDDYDGHFSEIDQDIEGITITVGKKARTYSQDAAPVGTADDPLVEGDLWIETDNNNKLYRYDGSAWQASPYSDPDKYTVQSGVAINTNGVEIQGSKYVSITSGTSEWKLAYDGLYYALNGTTGMQLDANGMDLTGSKHVKVTSGGSVWELAYNGLNYTLNGNTGLSIDSNGFTVNAGHITLNSGHDLVAGSWKFNDNGITYNNNTVQFYVKVPAGNIWFDANYPIIFTPERTTTDDVGYIMYKNGNYYHLAPHNQDDTHFVTVGAYTNRFDQGNFNWLYTTHTPSTTSTREAKHDIHDIDSCGDKLDQLRPVTFIFNDDVDNIVQAGLIYEEAVEVLPIICTTEKSPGKGIQYESLIPFLLKEIQDLRGRVKTLEEAMSRVSGNTHASDH